MDVPTPSGVPDPEAASFAEPVERAHGIAAWREKKAFRANILVIIDDEPILEGELWMTTDLSRSRIDRSDGTTVVWDGTETRVAPSDAVFAGAGAHLLGWTNWLAAPFELRDAGTYLEPLDEKAFRGRSYEAARLTFAPGVGERFRESYVVYKDPQTERLAALGPVTMLDGGVDSSEPWAITYEELERIDGVLLPTHGTIWPWSDNGVQGDSVGTVRLSNPRFVTPGDDTFAVPEGARVVSKPVSER